MSHLRDMGISSSRLVPVSPVVLRVGISWHALSFRLTRKRKRILFTHLAAQRHQKRSVPIWRKHRWIQVRMFLRDRRSFLPGQTLLVIRKSNHPPATTTFTQRMLRYRRRCTPGSSTRRRICCHTRRRRSLRHSRCVLLHDRCRRLSLVLRTARTCRPAMHEIPSQQQN
jgi:hypothetical protein